ncbi:DUF4191 domain-containing protein [Demequina muriae]|uniref:DUF4191 domain-containing protein n=1 Tax=Demequina muriae TaxID=3051664 RepID=A0ABT8GJC4_9MICO|nr:DUF4191 domain-containing protein [Demequina sp. EGI L300058]MDN4481532.1 DUF4191 domain-containing protein [Demequina sp. EGI L300058]
MAKEPQKKPRWYKLVAQAYKATAPDDKWLLPLMILIPVGVIGLSVLVGLLAGSTIVLVYAILFGVLAAALAAMYTLTRRFEKNAFQRMEGQMGASVSIAQSIRRGWKFDDDPVSIDPRGKSLVFQGIGKGGVVLLAEGGNAANKQVTAVKRRISKLVPGVPVHTIYVGTGEGQVPLKNLTKAIRKHKKALTKDQREQVGARLRAIGGQKLPVPKGVDPMRARPDRKAMRGR